MLYKSEVVKKEFWSDVEPSAMAIVLYADAWCIAKFGHGLTITDASRSQSEYDRVPEYAEAIARGVLANGRKSYWTDAAGARHYAGPMPHLADYARGLRCRAVDAGLRHGPFAADPERLSVEEARALVDHLNASFHRIDGKPTAILHDVGSGPHVHIQAEVRA